MRSDEVMFDGSPHSPHEALAALRAEGMSEWAAANMVAMLPSAEFAEEDWEDFVPSRGPNKGQPRQRNRKTGATRAPKARPDGGSGEDGGAGPQPPAKSDVDTMKAAVKTNYGDTVAHRALADSLEERAGKGDRPLAKKHRDLAADLDRGTGSPYIDGALKGARTPQDVLRVLANNRRTLADIHASGLDHDILPRMDRIVAHAVASMKPSERADAVMELRYYVHPPPRGAEAEAARRSVTEAARADVDSRHRGRDMDDVQADAQESLRRSVGYVPRAGAGDARALDRWHGKIPGGGRFGEAKAAAGASEMAEHLGLLVRSLRSTEARRANYGEEQNIHSILSHAAGAAYNMAMRLPDDEAAVSVWHALQKAHPGLVPPEAQDAGRRQQAATPAGLAVTARSFKDMPPVIDRHSLGAVLQEAAEQLGRKSHLEGRTFLERMFG